MSHRKIILIEAPTNLGLIRPGYGEEPGVRYLPDAINEAGFENLVRISEKLRVEPPPYSVEIDQESGVRNADAIASYSQQLADVVERYIRGDPPLMVCGGDCSVLIGAAVAIKRAGRYALFYIDGHTDYVLPHQSETAAAAGMDLATITGNGPQKLTNIEGLKPYLEEEDVFCFGNRYFDREYVARIRKSRIHYFDLNDIRREGISMIVKDFLQMVRAKKLDGFWIHLDADSLDDEIMPCVDSRQNDGLSYAELAETLEPLIASQYFRGLEITILDPLLDPQRIYINAFVAELAVILRQI